MKNLYITFFWLALAFVLVLFSLKVYAETRSEGPFGNHIWYDMRDKNLKEWKLEDHVKKEQVAVVSKPIVKPIIKPVEQRNEVKPTNDTFDLDKFAIAVAKHETSSCTKGFGKEYNNCFGLKNGRIAPCKKIGRLRMCIYDTPEESYEAFKKIWTEGYGGKFPSYKAAEVYSGKDRTPIWYANVKKFYYEQF